ncbi:Permease of the drug/metabolite transporter (DMT) superfamily [Thermoactinomyces sp. DSM 45891]|uniref:DMT family transporter n=1 Tax=Thermoactinomyces sp. DSM 45891 TaxID=1761907 RepID=UPI0009172A56|nr:DMT family transporter [Thermoactinomyces sp. DSM 45891]SFX07466.1 Permease of the drug/metabolite transporter (DMT) superfamily [Thermoactinomyces sp. DSM 45891]
MLAKKQTIYIMLLANMVLWGSSFVTSKIAINSVQAPVSASIRFGLSALICGLFLMIQTQHPRKVSKKNLGKLFIMGVSGIAIYNWLFFVGLSHTQASDGAVIIPAMSPVLTTCLAFFLLKQRQTLSKMLGLALALSGAAIFFFSTAVGSLDQARLWGDLMFIGSSACWAVYTMIGRTVFQEVHPLIATSYALIFGGILLVFVALPQYSQVSWEQVDTSFWIVQLYTAIFPTVLANFFFSYGVKSIGPTSTAMFMFFVPISGLVLSIIWLHESLNQLQLVGSVVIILGIWLMNKKVAVAKDPAQVRTN